MSIADHHIAETPVAVIDFETTGLSPKTGSRVIEVAVVRIEPGDEPRLVLDTLVDPDGPVHATRIHGITDDDVLGAPLFSDLVANVAQALEGAVAAAFNASFDMRFLEHELQRSRRGRQAWIPPHLCLMYARPDLGLGPKCSLSAACTAHGLPPSSHRAADDAFAGARLWLVYREAALQRRRSRFGALRVSDAEPFTRDLVRSLEPAVPPGQLKPRLSEPLDVAAPSIPTEVDRRREYWHTLVEALADGVVTPEEMKSLRSAQQQWALPAGDIRAVHAKLAAEVMAGQIEDEVVSASEVGDLTSLFTVLRGLGWAPGDPA